MGFGSAPLAISIFRRFQKNGVSIVVSQAGRGGDGQDPRLNQSALSIGEVIRDLGHHERPKGPIDIDDGIRSIFTIRWLLTII